MKTTKKVLAMVLAIMMIVTVASVATVSAAAPAITFKITPSATEVKPGEEFTVAFSTDNAKSAVDEVFFLQFVMTYDKDLFEVVLNDKGKPVKSGDADITVGGKVAEGDVLVSLDNNGAMADLTKSVWKDGEAFGTLTMKAKADAKLDSTATFAGRIDERENNSVWAKGSLDMSDESSASTVDPVVADATVTAATVKIAEPVVSTPSTPVSTPSTPVSTPSTPVSTPSTPVSTPSTPVSTPESKPAESEKPAESDKAPVDETPKDDTPSTPDQNPPTGDAGVLAGVAILTVLSAGAVVFSKKR